MTDTAMMYGGSLYDLAAEEGLETRILGELDEAVALFKANPDYLHLLSTPSIPKRERCGLLDEALRDQVHLYVLNFLKILCEKGTLRELSGCARAYRVRYNQAHRILEATAPTAVAMTEQQAKSLHEKQITLPNVELVWNAAVEEITGEAFVTGVQLLDTQTKEERFVAADGIFIAVGIQPVSESFKSLVKTDEAGYICAGEDCCTSVPGIFAVGDVRTKKLRQIVTAVADGANAVNSVQEYFQTR